MILLLRAGMSSSDHVREHVARTGPKALKPRTSVRRPAKGIGLTTEVGGFAHLNQRTDVRGHNASGRGHARPTVHQPGVRLRVPGRNPGASPRFRLGFSGPDGEKGDERTQRETIDKVSWEKELGQARSQFVGANEPDPR
jgi:hypothetical protein